MDSLMNDKTKKPSTPKRSGGTYRDMAIRLEKEKNSRPPAVKHKDGTTKIPSYFDKHKNDSEAKVKVCPITGEKMYEFIHPSGAKLVYIHKESAMSSGAVTLPYGGDDTHVSSANGYKALSFAGCAHFAEHMLFTGKGGRLERFLSMGADANACTSSTATVYSFTSETEEGTISAFSELMKMVLRPELDFGQVEKEREIILRELSEEDDVFSEGRERLVKMLWSRGSVRRDPGGSAKYVRRISGDMIKNIYSAAYIPSEMTFSLVSDIGVGNAKGIFEMNLLGIPYKEEAKHLYCRNIPGGKKKRDVFYHESGSTVLFLGMAPDTSVPEESGGYAKRYVYTALLESMIFDRTEPIFLELLSRCGGIYGEFVSDSEIRRDDCILSANLMCEDPIAVADEFLKIYKEYYESGKLFSFEHFESKRRAVAADYLSITDSPAELSLSVAEYMREGDSFFSVAEVLKTAEKEEFVEWAKKALSGREFAVAAADNNKTEKGKKTT